MLLENPIYLRRGTRTVKCQRALAQMDLCFGNRLSEFKFTLLNPLKGVRHRRNLKG
jgi:hypothetical protein